MSFADKVTALRRFFGVAESLELMPAIVGMNLAMGIAGEGPFPSQVDMLIKNTGVVVQAAAEETQL